MQAVAHLKTVFRRPVGWLVVVFCCLVSSAFGHNTSHEYLHQIWRAEEGIPDPVVRQIIQSREGYLWLATEDSLMRFDGVRFEEMERRTNSERADRWFTALLETQDGSIWSSSANGGLFWWKEGQGKLFKMKDGLPSNYIMSLCEDRQGTLWIGTSVGLVCYTNGNFIPYTNNVPGLLQSSVRAMLEDHEGNLWIGTANGLSKKTGNTFVSYTNLTANISVMSIYEDREKRLWMGTGKGLTLYENGTTKHFLEADGLKHGTVRGVIEDQEGHIWVGTQGGVQQLINGRFEAPVIHSTSDFDDSITWVYTLTEDSEGDIWVGTNLGLNRLKPKKFQVFSKENGLVHNAATLTFQDRSGAKWIGTYGGGLMRLHNGEQRVFNTTNGLPSNFIISLCEDREGTLWIGTDGAGLVRYRDGKFTQYMQRDDVRRNTVRVIYEDKKGDLWIGSNSSFGRFRDGKFQNETNIIVAVRTILEDRHGSLWVGSRTGLMQWTNGVVNTYMKKDGLGGTQVLSMYEDFDGALWIGTDMGGLTRYKDGKFTHLGAAEGFFKERVLHLLDDGFGNFWMATRNGIFSVGKKELASLADNRISEATVLSFGKKDGLKRAQCNGIAQPSGWKMEDGSLWFPTMHGVVSFNPREVASNAKPPPVKIQGIAIDGKPVAGGVSPLLIPPSRGNVEIFYTALSFQEPDRVKFRYRLDGLDTEWQDGGTSRSVTYNNLDPGEYEFHVIACNNDGVWNETGATIAFELKSHFYQSYVFFAGCILLAGLAIWGFFRWRVKHLHRRQAELAALVEEKTRELQQEIVERKQTEEALRKSQEMVLRQERLAVVGQLSAGIAHEFNNILTVVQGHTCLLLSKDDIPEEEKQPLEKISVAAERAANLTRQLLTFSRKQMMQVRPLDLNEVVNSMTVMLRRVLGEHIVVNFNYCANLPKVCADAGMMEQIIINLAVNARDAMPKSGGHLTVSLADKVVVAPDRQKNPDAREGHFVCISVADTGCGIPPEDQKKIFEPFFTTKEVGKGTGLGLATVYGIVKQHQGWIEIDSEVNKGTTFTVFVPLAGPAQTKPSA